MAKKRFGVSIEQRLYSKLDEVTKSLGVDRSAVVEEALRNYLSDLNHLAKAHTCCGLVVVEDPDTVEMERILAGYKDIIVNYSHHHIAGKCIYTIMVLGNSEALATFYSRVSKTKGHGKRYIPLHSD
jgi:CopG family nickel-responsive transcriptional regulator|uniref:Ribbon-helix-helix domain-containing protein n=1 Tax=Ignisphaera aggregans TaxID=334771 RepID=A0A7J2U0U4_9CREN